MKNPTFPDNENEIADICFNLIKYQTLSKKEFKKDKKHTHKCFTNKRGFTPTSLFIGFDDVLRCCGVDYVGM